MIYIDLYVTYNYQYYPSYPLNTKILNLRWHAGGDGLDQNYTEEIDGIGIDPLNPSDEGEIFVDLAAAIAFYKDTVATGILSNLNTYANEEYAFTENVIMIDPVTNDAIVDLQSQIDELPTAAHSGSFNDLLNKPSTGTPNTSPGRSLTSSTGAAGFRPSTTKPTFLCYNVETSNTASIGTDSSSEVFLEVCATNSSTAGDWIKVGRVGNDQQLGLSLAVSSKQIVYGQLTYILPTNWYAKLRNAGTGTHTETIDSQVETLMAA